MFEMEHCNIYLRLWNDTQKQNLLGAESIFGTCIGGRKFIINGKYHFETSCTLSTNVHEVEQPFPLKYIAGRLAFLAGDNVPAL